MSLGSLLLLSAIAVKAAAWWSTADALGLHTVHHATVQLSQARSDIGAAAAGGAAVFGGGCAAGSTKGGKDGGGCKEPTAAIDVLRPSSSDPAVWELAAGLSVSLGEARGWVATCSFGPQQDLVAFLGGATEKAGSRTLDLLSVSTGAVHTNPMALEKGRWGTACAPAGDGSQVVFGGGKAFPNMVGEVFILKAGISPKLVTASSLSQAREDCAAVGWGATGALFAGGWVSNTLPGFPSAVVDTFEFDPDTKESTTAEADDVGHWVWDLGTPVPSQEWLGAVSWNASTVFLADATTLYEVSSKEQFTGQAPVLRRPLPTAIAASAGIPAARLQQNGVHIPGAVCFYASLPTSTLLCWSPGRNSWQQFICSETHLAGAITAVDGTVFIGGGYDADNNITAHVDVFSFSDKPHEDLIFA